MGMANNVQAAYAATDAGNLMFAKPMGLLSYGPEYTAMNAQGFTPTAPSWIDKLSAGYDKFQPYIKTAQMAQELTSPQEQPQAPQIQPPQLRGPSASLNPTLMYGSGGLYGADPEEERRRLMALLAQQQGVA
jgi:hypothetical protein